VWFLMQRGVASQVKGRGFRLGGGAWGRWGFMGQGFSKGVGPLGVGTPSGVEPQGHGYCGGGAYEWVGLAPGGGAYGEGTCLRERGFYQRGVAGPKGRVLPQGVWQGRRGRGWPHPPHLHGHVGHDGALVALEGLQGDLGDLALRFAQEHLAGGRQHLLVLPLDLHLPPGEDPASHARPSHARTPPRRITGGGPPPQHSPFKAKDEAKYVLRDLF